MKRVDYLRNKIERYLEREQLLKSEEYYKLEKSFLKKARKNIIVANLNLKISENEELKHTLKLSSDFEMYDWVIIVSYYAMYISALAALAKLGYKSQSHAATLAILEYNYVHKGLEIKYLHKLTKAHALSEALITKLIQTKTRRETAQYDATPTISKQNALSSLEDAQEFITKIEEILL